ncbi:MAG: anthranilate synthase component I family protein [Flavobacteriales bacterium]|nr:anthranilate synthase component I family protein [Flavobacteriales bacterium]MCB9191031.1 anthranilate synthase component I family protein [Flavobacteriales bacterium]MCB9203378.1 anthranilate synthase component I family protein [Flavobacteriales bacterium]
MSWVERKHVRLPDFSLNAGVLDGFDVVFQLDFESFAELNFQGSTIKFSKILGLGADDEMVARAGTELSSLKGWLDEQSDLVFGYFSYDLKNDLEKLTSSNSDSIGFPAFNLVVPQHLLVYCEQDGWHCFSHGEFSPGSGQRKLSRRNIGNPLTDISVHDYVHKVENLRQHIQFGDIYEVNYCVQHGFKDAVIDPFSLYNELKQSSPAPFSCYVADRGKYLLSASPERFIQKIGSRIVSQPIKGTNRRTSNNEVQKELLRTNAKEVSENVMITDLVRNDLSKSARKGTVKVEELCGIYEFEHVNQMISTVSAEMRDDVHPLDVVLNAFPMGSMTGAPKIRAMKLIDQYEDFSRGLYSGAVGYFTPELDFDFNVVIRSILYNEEKKTVTFPTGGAITINSVPELEYEECMLKAEAMRNVLLNHAK